MPAVPELLRLPLCVAGIWSCFFVYGVQQEGIFRYKSEGGEKFQQTMLLLVLEHGMSTVVAAFVVLVLGQTSNQSWGPFLRPSGIVATAQALAKYTSNEALKSVSFPIQALAKSSKTIPAMFGAFWSGKKITAVQWGAALGITAGTAAFSLVGKRKGGIEATPFGVLLLVASLVCDGTVSAAQQGMRASKKNLTAYEQMFLTNFGAALLLLPFAVMNGQLADGVQFLLANPALMRSVGIVAVCSAIGQIFIFLTIVWFGPDTNAKITTVRKMATVLISITWYGHAMATEQWFAVGLVFASVFAELLEQLRRPKGHGKLAGTPLDGKAKAA